MKSSISVVCTQLEELIANKDLMLLESNKRFELLRDDFQYNLTLLEARDHEIDRLEGVLQGQKDTITSKDAEIRVLSSKVELLLLKESELSKQREEERAQNKQMLAVLKEEIEYSGWMAKEELKAKEKTIDELKTEMQRLHVNREEALELQRKDLESAYEQLLQSREAEFSQSEEEIAGQIQLLDRRFEQLRSDNTRLKAELSDSLRKQESLSVDLSRREEQLRELQWKIHDSVDTFHGVEDGLQRKVQQLLIELSSANESHLRECGELQRKIDTLTAELMREKEFRGITEKRLEEIRQAMNEKASSLERELMEGKLREEAVQREVYVLRQERDEACDRSTAARDEVDGWERKARLLAKEKQELVEKLSRLQLDLHSSEHHLSDSESAVAQLRNEVLSTKAVCEQQKQIELAAMQKHSTDNWEIAREAILANAQLEKSALEKSLREELERVESRLSREKSELSSKVEELQRRLGEDLDRFTELTNALSKEQTESNALRLRLQFLESKSQKPQRLSGTKATAAMDSPMFSDDFGAISIPNSPFVSPFRENPRGTIPPRPTIDIEEGSMGTYEENDRAPVDSKLFEENERLKSIIRVMRADIESLQSQITGPEDEEHILREKVAQLERRLEQTTAEVQRLRDDRRKLMDVSNELRAVVNKSSRAMESSDRQRNERGRSPSPRGSVDISSRRQQLEAFDPRLDGDTIDEEENFETPLSLGKAGSPRFFSRRTSLSDTDAVTGSASAAGLPTTNSERATLSQLKARHRLAIRQLQKTGVETKRTSRSHDNETDGDGPKVIGTAPGNVQTRFGSKKIMNYSIVPNTGE